MRNSKKLPRYNEEEIIVLENVSKAYTTGAPALDNVSIKIGKGEFVFIVGDSGSGKSTLMQHLNGLLKPTSGQILLDGKDIWSDKALTRQARFRVGLVFQYPEYQLFEETVFKDIAFGPKNMGLSKEEIERNVYEAMEMVGLSKDLKDRSPFELSGGQKRRVAIAWVLSMKPEILVLDEPTAGLDPKGRDSLLDRIEKLHKNSGMTVIFVSHSMEEVARLAKNVVVMNDGRVYAKGSVAEIFERGYELQKIGLNIPQITQLTLKLREKGVDIRPDIYTVNFAKEVIFEKIRKGESNA